MTSKRHPRDTENSLQNETNRLDESEAFEIHQEHHSRAGLNKQLIASEQFNPNICGQSLSFATVNAHGEHADDQARQRKRYEDS